MNRQFIFLFDLHLFLSIASISIVNWIIHHNFIFFVFIFYNSIKKIFQYGSRTALKIKRANAKRSLTAYKNFLNNIDASKNFPVEKSFNKIDKVLDTLHTCQSELKLLLMIYYNSKKLTQYRETFEKQYFET